MFSVIIPNYNMAQFVGLSIKSVLAQTNPDFEIIVVDNCSTDLSWDEINQFVDNRIRPFKQVANLGMYANLNVAIMLAKGKYLKIQCSDDILHPQCLEILSKAIFTLSSKENKPLYIGYKMISGIKGEDYSQEWYNQELLSEFTWNDSSLIDEIPIGLPNVCIDSQAFRKFGAFGTPDIQKDFSRDLLRLGLFTQYCKCYEINLPLSFERAHTGQSRFSLKKQWQLNEVYELYFTTGIINTKKGKENIKTLAGIHLASAIKYLFSKRKISYIIHTLKFAFQKRLLGLIYLRSFLSRVYYNIYKV